VRDSANCPAPSEPATRSIMDERETKQHAALTASDWGSPLHVRALVLIVVTGGAIYFCYLLAKPFIPALAVALSMAVLFTPLHRWIESKVKRPNLAAMLSIIVIGIIVVVPATFVTERIIGQVTRAATTVQAKVESGEWRSAIEGQPGMARVGHWIDQYFDLPGVVQSAASWLTNVATSFVRSSILQLIGFALTFYMLFYFLRDKGVALDAFRSLSPLSQADMNRLFGEVVDTIHATLYGTFSVAAVQGLLGGLMFWWLGLPEPLLWGVVMGLLAVVPVLGAFIIWIPAAVLLAIDGSVLKALLLTFWGAVVVGGIDNLLYPLLVGRRMKMHSIIAFVSIVGGLIVIGPAGLILGPVTFAITRVLLEIWSRRNAATSA
jgi:predicted PurR-regulated permease PerM